MKRFLVNILLLFVVNVLLLLCVDTYKYLSGSFEAKMNGAEIYIAMRVSQQKRYVKKLILGDSVGKQLYETGNVNDSITSLACNQAITMAGHYFLLRNFVDANMDSLPEDVYLLFHPSALANSCDIYTYHYFLKPFHEKKYKESYNSHLKDRIKEIPCAWSAQLPFIRTSNYSPEYHLKKVDEGLLSSLTRSYLDSIICLASENHIELHLLACPVSRSYYRDNESCILNIDSINLGILHSYINEWKNSLIQYDDSCFQDMIHFQPHCIPRDLYCILKSK